MASAVLTVSFLAVRAAQPEGDAAAAVLPDPRVLRGRDRRVQRLVRHVRHVLLHVVCTCSLIRGYSAFEAGVRFLPMTVAIIIVAPNAGKYASKHGSRVPMTFGLILAGVGLLLAVAHLDRHAVPV